jgi:hypothetical protein
MFLLTLKRLDGLWCPLILLFSVYLGIFPRGSNDQDGKVITPLHPLSWLRITGAYLSPHVPSWRAQRQVYVFCYTVLNGKIIGKDGEGVCRVLTYSVLPAHLKELRKATETSIWMAVFNFEFRTHKLPTKKANCNPMDSIFVPKCALFIRS